MSFFFSIPDDVISEVLSDWLQFNELTLLDSATCNNKYRPNLLHLFRTSVFVDDKYLIVAEIYRWIFLKGIKLIELQLADYVINFILNVPIDFSNVVTLYIETDLFPVKVAEIVNSCINLRSLYCGCCDIILLCDSIILNKITTLQLSVEDENIDGSEALNVIGLSCTNLLSFNSYSISVSEEKCNLFDNIIINNCSSLASLIFSGSTENLLTVAKHCSKLCRLTLLNSNKIFDLSVIDEILRNNFNLVDCLISCLEGSFVWFTNVRNKISSRMLTINGNRDMNGDIESFLLRIISGWQSVQFKGVNVTSSTLNKFIERNCNTLWDITIVNCNFVSMSSLSKLLECCTELRELTFHSSIISDLRNIFIKSNLLEYIVISVHNVEVDMVITILNVSPRCRFLRLDGLNTWTNVEEVKKRITEINQVRPITIILQGENLDSYLRFEGNEFDINLT